ncbi:MAG: hypothetical protein AB7H96_01795 [Vicinamibacterales bacterium]
MSGIRSVVLGSYLLSAGMAATSIGLTAQGVNPPVRFTAVAQDLDRGLSTPIRIAVTRWSSEAVEKNLVNVLMTKGADQLLEALRSAPTVGTIGTTTSLAWDLHFARQTRDEDGGTRIVLGTDRPIAFSEQWAGSRTLDYPFTVIELHLDDDGTGEGTLSFATRVIPHPSSHSVVLENWGTQRVRLTQVRPER